MIRFPFVQKSVWHRSHWVASAAIAPLLMAGMLSGASVAAPATTQAAATITVPPINYQTRTLKNGLKVYYARDTTTPNVTVQMWYGVGSKDDPNGRSGFAHLFEHLMFKATRDLPPESFDRLTEDMGGFNNASTWDDFTNYFEVIPSSSLERLIWAESQRLETLVVDEDSFKSERNVVKEELRQRVLASPYGRLFALYIPQNAYSTHPYKRPGIGSIEELDAATVDDVQAFHATYYRPDNAALIVVGNFDEAELNGWIDKYLAPVKTPDKPLPRVNVVEPARTGSKTVTTYGPNVPLPAVVMTWLGPKASDKDAAAVQVLNAILSSGKSSRLYNSLVYDKQVAAEIFSTADLPAEPGLIYAGAILSDGKTLTDVEPLLAAEIASMRDKPVSEAELSEAKTELIAAAVRERETIDNRAFALGYALLTEGDPARANSSINDLSAVTAADVQAVARKYLLADRVTTIRYVSETERPKGEAASVASVATVPSVKFTGEVYALRPEGQREAMPPLGKAVNPVLPAPAEMTLPNGLKVVVAKSSDLPLIAARLVVRAGASSDPAGKAGTANLMSDVITEGTKTRTAQDIASQSEALGTEISAASDWESATLDLSVVKTNLKPALSILADVAQNPVFNAEDVERMRTQELDGLKVAYQQPGTLAAYAAAPILYAGTPMGHVQAGTPASLPRIVREDLIALHKGAWRPDNAVLVLTGDITPEAGFALARAAFAGWKAPAGKPLSAPKITPVSALRDVVIDLPGTGQAAVRITKTAIPRSDPGYYTGIVTNSVLGGGYSSRLNQEIRVRRSLSYGAGSSLSARLSIGSFAASVQTKNESAAEVVGLVKAEMTRLAAQPVTPEELTARKLVLIGDYGRDLGTADGLATILGNLSFYKINLAEIQAYTTRVEAVTPDQVKAFAATYLDPAKTSVIIAGDRARMGDAVTAALPKAEVIAVTALDLDSATLKAAK
jgi:zinc protease